MNAHLYRILIFAAFACLFFPSSAEAQKNKLVGGKTAAKTPAKTETKTELKAANSVEKMPALSELEMSIVSEINQVRNNPQSFIAYLEEYKKYLIGKMLSLPNKPKMVMIEGLPAVEDAIIDLKKLSKQNSFAVSNGLSKVARYQLLDLQENPSLKHFGKDGSTLDVRMSRVGFSGGAIAENISHRVEAAREVILAMIIDDGVKSRSHRKNIFSPTFKLFGIACGIGKDARTLCVAEFADDFQENR
jgi:uncharacterized protein YkwD